jgi:uracil-DNA glycosylase
MGQNPGANEVKGMKLIQRYPERWESHRPAPFLGKTGYAMEHDFFPVAGLERGKVDLTNSVRCRLNDQDSLPDVAIPRMREAIEHCRVHDQRPANIKLIVAEGEHALYATTGEDGTDSPGFKISRGISGWRGWLLPHNPPPLPKRVFNQIYEPSRGELSVLPTYHVAYLFRNPWEKPNARADWHKVQRILRGTWPESFPHVERIAPTVWPGLSAYDTEFYQTDEEYAAPTRLIRWSLATRSPVGVPRVWVVEAGYQDFIKTPPSPRVYFWNVEADIDHLKDLLGQEVKIDIEDAMFIHAILWPDLGHKLDEAGSVYARTNRWKHLVHSNPTIYAGGDALGTLDVALSLTRELERDPRSKWVYEHLTLPLVPIINKGHKIGSRVHQGRVLQALGELDVIQASLTEQARAYTGYPINLGSSDQVAQWLYDVEQVHLNPVTGRSRIRRGKY